MARGGWNANIVAMFLAFAFAYFLSALLRAVTATLAPTFSQELGLTSADLGLLAGAYFLGFSLTQLPLGHALDRWGPKRVVLVLLTVASLACLAFAQSTSMMALVASRMAIGMGVSACLMAPLTAYRKVMAPDQQQRANAWMLMTGSLGMLASTLPVYWLLPLVGWRGLFIGLGMLVLVSVALIAWRVPLLATRPPSPSQHPPGPLQATPGPAVSSPRSAAPGGYLQILSHPRFVQLGPAGFFCYGGMVAVQSLWAGPWLTTVAGYSTAQAAQGLFAINLSMLFAFFTWGVVMPKLAARGIDPHALIRWGLVLPLIVMPINIALGDAAGAGLWALWCVSSTFVAFSQPQIAQEFEASLAGRALSAFNLVIFVGIFVVQWGIGILIDAGLRRGWSPVDAFRGAFGVFGALCLASYLWYLWCERALRAAPMPPGRDNAAP